MKSGMPVICVLLVVMFTSMKGWSRSGFPPVYDEPKIIHDTLVAPADTARQMIAFNLSQGFIGNTFHIGYERPVKSNGYFSLYGYMGYAWWRKISNVAPRSLVTGFGVKIHSYRMKRPGYRFIDGSVGGELLLALGSVYDRDKQRQNFRLGLIPMLKQEAVMNLGNVCQLYIHWGVGIFIRNIKQNKLESTWGVDIYMSDHAQYYLEIGAGLRFKI